MLLNSQIGRFVIGSLCVGDLVRLGLRSVRVAGFSLQHGHYSNSAAPNRQHTTNREQNDRCGNSTAHRISCILLVSLSSPYVHDARSQEPKTSCINQRYVEMGF